jgi:glycogen(starch) synthase
VRLVIAGEGPTASARAHARASSASRPRRLPRRAAARRVVELFRAADASILSSSWENFPHTVVEALAVGTPVLAMEAGGVGEVVHDGVNGLLVPAGDGDALAGAVRRYFADDALARAAARGRRASVAAYAPERVFGELETTLRRVASA